MFLRSSFHFAVAMTAACVGVGVFAGTARAATLFSIASADAGISQNVAAAGVDGGGTVFGLSDTILQVGGPPSAGPNGIYNNAVFVFPLPSLGAVANPFLTADFTVYSSGGENIFASSPSDIYGLGARTASTVVGGDYYFGTADATDATVIQQGFRQVGATSATSGDAFTTSTTGSVNLRSYLNAQYATGANAGKFVFLRINTTTTDTFFKYQNYFSGDQGGATVPKVNYTTSVVVVPEAGTLGLLCLPALIGGITLARRRN